ncbi:MAG: hypothetical protein AB7I50_24490 [Vicinamibacterales bacterium]
MSFVQGILRRAFAVVLLAAVVGGPAGLAGTLHEADDVACAPGAADTQQRVGVPQDEASHCPTCHLLRSLRFGLAEDLEPLATALRASAEVADRISVAVDAPLPLAPGRSPPVYSF